MDNPSPTATEQDPTPSPGGEPTTTGPRVSRDEMKDLGRLRRSVTDRHIAGVAGGLARHLDIDAIIVRVALVVGVFFGGAGLLLYVGAWLLVPEEGTDDEPLGLDRRSRSIAIAGVGILALLAAVGDWAGASWFSWPVAVVGAIVVLFLHRKERGSRPRTGYGYGDGDAEPAAQTSAQTTYAAPAEPQHWETYERAPRPRNPRKRGPILFLFTLALVALAEGTLGVVDLSGVGVADSAYPALALGIIATMLVVGSFWGRAGGLIALGVVAALATAATTAASGWQDEDVQLAPTGASEVRDQYDMHQGTFVLDLSGIEDVEELDGQDISIDGGAGMIEVVVPDGTDVSVAAEVGVGSAHLFAAHTGGLGISEQGSLSSGTDAPDLTLSIDLGVGEVVVREAA